MPTTLLVADSFRVREHPATRVAEVRGLTLHLGRFSSAVREVWPEAAGLEAFLKAARARIAAFGTGFPRLELRAGSGDAGAAPRLDVALRPLPELGASLELRTADRQFGGDPRVKGPRIAAYARLNRELGAEAALVDREGAVVEGTTTALLWWRAGALQHVASPARIPSVTERLVLEVARHAGHDVEATSITARELARTEVWAVNALHGIRPVTRFDGRATADPDPARLAHYRRALDRTWERVARQ